jgi:ketosteroid isomerase-like protein
MATVDDFDQAVEQVQRALGEFLNGNPEPWQNLWSHREDVTLANPLGPPARGWEQVAQILERASKSFIRDGEITSFEPVAKYVTPELAYIMWIEQTKGKVGERDDVTPFALRVTTIFRPEDGTWKVVHRHADPITTPQPAESVIQE